MPTSEKLREVLDKWDAEINTLLAQGNRAQAEQIQAILVSIELSLAAETPEQAYESLTSRWRRLFGSDLTGKPEDVAFIEDAGEIYNDGFEAMHALQPCGHSRGDYRDADYIPGKPWTYTASESCIGCEREAELRGIIKGLEDVIAGRVKPLSEIKAALAQPATEKQEEVMPMPNDPENPFAPKTQPGDAPSRSKDTSAPLCNELAPHQSQEVRCTLPKGHEGNHCQVWATTKFYWPAESLPAEEAGTPWAYAIETPGGDMYDGEYAVFGDEHSCRDQVENLNDDLDETKPQYKLVPLYRAAGQAAKAGKK